MRLQTASWRTPLASLLAALPWLNPFAGGPSPAVVPWLVSMACGVLLWTLAWAHRTHPGLPRGLLVAAMGLVAWAALVHGPVRPEAAMLAAGVVLVLLAAAAARCDDLAAALQAGLLAAAVLNALIGLLQYFGGSAAAAPLLNVSEAGQAFGNVRQTNQFATLCWLGTAVLLFGTLRVRLAVAAAVVVVLAVASAASASRTGLLAGVVLLALCAWWKGPERRSRLVLAAAAAGAYGVAAVLLPWLLELATGGVADRTLWARFGAGASCASRSVLWSNVLELIAAHPWTGWGWGQLDFAHYATLYAGPRFCEILDNAHNLPLHLAVELGVPLAVLASAAALVWAWRARPWHEDAPLRRLAWALLALVLLHSLLEYPLWYGRFQLVLGICLGWLARPSQAPRDHRPARLRLLAASVLLATTAYAAWDYARVSQIYLPPAQRLAPWRDDALAHARRSWLFSGPARFADVTLAEPTRANAEWMYREASRALHYSPEPRVIERVIESAVMLGRAEEALLHLARYRAAFPSAYAAWRRRQGLAAQP